MPPHRRLGILTYEHAPDLTTDDRLLIRPLLERGISVHPLVWSAIDPSTIDAEAVIIRSTWDYHLQPERFLEFLSVLEHRGIRVLNDGRTVRWNMRKDYLLELCDAGIILPRTLLASTWTENLLTPFRKSAIVIKPVISASAHDTHRFLTWNPEQVRREAVRIMERCPVIIQEYMPEVESPGEWALIFIDREFSHAIVKTARPDDFRVQEEHGGTLEYWVPAPSLIDQAARVLDQVDGDLAYARVDGVVREGIFNLMELELIEPALYMAFNPTTAIRLADAIAQRMELHGKR